MLGHGPGIGYTGPINNFSLATGSKSVFIDDLYEEHTTVSLTGSRTTRQVLTLIGCNSILPANDV